jgi:hypothetical protein
MVVHLEGSPISTEELCQSDHQVLGHSLTNSRLLSLAGLLALGRVLVVPNFFNVRIMEAIVFLETFNAAEMFWYPSPDLCLDTCTVNCGTLYRQVCAFQYHVQSIELTTGGLQSSCRNTSRMLNGNRMMHLSYISSLIAKGLNTYVNIFFVALSFWGIVCKLLRKKCI